MAVDTAGSHQDAPTDDPPLFVDLDGTLVRTDLLVESFLARVRRSPGVALAVLAWLPRGRAFLKARLAEGDPLDASTLPYHETLVERLREEARRGRRLVLATAAHRSLAEAVAGHLGFFSEVLASDGERNLRGRTKLEAIRACAGEAPFDYAGNAREDLPIWAEARCALLVAASPSVEARARRHGNVTDSLPSPPRRGAWWRALRPHQWLKNALVVVPLLTSVSFVAPEAWLRSGLAFAAFCALSSCAYVLNDLLDLAADRAHPEKRSRPFAAGALAPTSGLVRATALGTIGGLLALALPPAFGVLAGAYLATTLAYSLFLKDVSMADVVTLALLYTVRIVAGVAALGVALSFWLLAFSIFVFASLALMKRCTEIVMWRERGAEEASVRGYRVSDQAVMQSIGVGCACVAVLILALYIHSPEVTTRLRTPEILWPVCVVMLWWLGRAWLWAARGQMPSDPLVFAWKDPASLVAGAITVALFGAAALVQVPRLL